MYICLIYLISIKNQILLVIIFIWNIFPFIYFSFSKKKKKDSSSKIVNLLQERYELKEELCKAKKKGEMMEKMFVDVSKAKEGNYIICYTM